MKKLFAVIPAAVLAVTAVSGTTGLAASARGHHGGAGHCQTASVSRSANAQNSLYHYFCDTDNDGICDTCGSGTCLLNGMCGGKDHHNDHHGAYRVCEDCADGVCSQHGTGYGYHHRHHH